MKPEFRLATVGSRPGRRSCWRWRAGERVWGDGGTWYYVRSAAGSNQYLTDLEAVLRRLNPIEQSALKAEIKHKVKRAAAGKLTYGPLPGGDVEKMACVTAVLELRLAAHPVTEEDVGPLLTRIYFNEPDGKPGQLIGLHVAGKMPGPMIEDEQNAHAREAQIRLEACRFELLSMRES